MNVIATIINAAGVFISAIPTDIATAQHIQSLLQPDFTVTIQAIEAGAIKDADETLDLIAKWRSENGI